MYPFKNKLKNKKYIDKKRRLSFLKYEFFCNISKFVLMSFSFSLDIKKSIYLDYLLLNKCTSLVCVRNICFLTGRTRGNSYFLKMSRLKVKEMVSLGKLPGIIKSSW